MRVKRGTDHNWEIRKYRGDIAFYARCKCGFYYCCSSNVRNGDGSFSLKQYISKLYPYCPVCGARKKWYNKEPVKMKQEFPG